MLKRATYRGTAEARKLKQKWMDALQKLVGDISIDSVIKVANVKLESSYASEIKSVAKQIIGTCQTLGIKIEGKTPKEITEEINSGKWEEKFS